MRKGILAMFFIMVFLIMLELLPIIYNFYGNKIACVWFCISIANFIIGSIFRKTFEQ